MVAHLITLSQDLTDHAIEIHDRQKMVLQVKGRKTQEEMQKQNGKSVNEKVSHLKKWKQKPCHDSFYKYPFVPQ